MKVVIVRGLPGSGKSTLSELMIEAHSDCEGLCAWYSTDDYFVHDGEYKFDGRKLTKAHVWNQARFRRAVDNKYGLIIVDNTNTQFWEVVAYIEYALNNDYCVQIVEPETEWKFDVDELVLRNTHNVPKVSIEKMLQRWDTTQSILEGCEEKFDCKVDYDQSLVYNI